MANPFDDLVPRAPGAFDDLIPPERSIGDRIKRGIGLTAQGLTDAGANLLGLPGDVLSMVTPSRADPGASFGEGAKVFNEKTGKLESAPEAAPTRPVPLLPTSGDIKSGLDYVARAANAVSQGSTEPFSRSTRLTPENVGEKVISGASRGAGDAALWLTGAGAVNNSAQLGSAVQRIANALTKAPGTQLAAGAVGGATSEVTGNPWLGLAAGVGTAGIPSLAAGAGRQLRTAFVDPLTEAGAKRAVGEFLPKTAQQSADDLANALMGRPPNPVAASQPTTAEVARSPGLAAAERAQRGKSPEAFGARDIERNQARVAEMDALGPGIDPAQAGVTIRGAVKAGEGVARGQTKAAYDEARRLSTGVSVDPMPAYTQAAQRVGEVYGSKIIDTPPEIVKALQAMRAPNVSLDQLVGVRQAMSAVAGDVPKYGRTGAGVAGDVVRAIDDHIAGLVSGGQLPADVAAAWTKAAGLRSGQGAVFENKTVGPITAKEYGRETLPPEAVPGRFANKGKGAQTDASRLMSATRGDPAALEAVDQFIVDQVRKAAMPARGGTVMEERLAKALMDWSPAMQGVPGMPGRIEKAMTPVLSDLESARFAQNAGRGVGSNTFQNFAMDRAIDAGTLGVPVSKIPGVRQITSMVTRPLRSTEGYETRLREALTDALLNPDKAIDAIRFANPADKNNVVALLASVLGSRLEGDRNTGATFLPPVVVRP